ncbi:chorismate-binding protein [Myxococcota bacterium]|nr:chorismate-binding protein [Myxococcota bacterium]
MAKPTLQQFSDLAAADHPVAIPVWQEILADLDTPVSAFLKVTAGAGGNTFLLESVEGGETWGRYSVLGLDPAFVVRARGRVCERVEGGVVVHSEERDDPLTYLQEQLGRYAPASLPEPPAFPGGAVGWVSWEAVRWWEKLAAEHPGGPDPGPTLCFAVPRTLLIFDNVRHRIQVVRVVLTTPGADPAPAYEAAREDIQRTIHTLRLASPSRPQVRAQVTEQRSNTTKERYEQGVEAIREHIAAGEAIQVVLSQRFRFKFAGDAFDVYRALRATNPSPYMFYLDYPEQLVVGASPEVMVRAQGGEVMVAPIAGTRPRGATPEADAAMAEELLADPKERAEHVMLVDLGRNDLGRIAAPGTVKVTDLMRIERYSHVMHIVSTVKARLAAGKTGFDVLRATFPAGTLSGAPKVRAMQLLDGLEPEPRGLYGGAVGWVGFTGELDLCIAIRTAVRRGDEWSLQVGAGIVADSVPAAEHQETINKAAGVLRALALIGEGL